MSTRTIAGTRRRVEFSATTPLAEAQSSFQAAGEWLAETYFHPLDIGGLLRDCRQKAGSENSAIWLFGIRLKFAIADLLHADSGRDPWKDAADHALARAVRWDEVAEVLAAKYQPDELDRLSLAEDLEARADAVMASARAAEAGEELGYTEGAELRHGVFSTEADLSRSLPIQLVA